MVFVADDFKQYTEFIVSEIEEGFIHLQFNNPKTLNAFSEKLWREYHQLLVKLDADENTNVILISSAVPKSFSSGLDLRDAMTTIGNAIALGGEKRYQALHKFLSDFQYCIGTPARISTPTIALLNGINFGLALDISSCCSIRVAVEGAKFSIKEIKIGIPADIGSLQRMPRIVNNKSLLHQYALTGENFSAQDALNIGFVSKVVGPDLAAGVEYCKELGSEINGHQNWAIRGTKESLQYILDGGSTEQGLKNIAHYNATNMDGRFLEALGGPKL